MAGHFARSWYRFKNWFRTKPGPGEPLRFLRGSEKELQRVTTWICHCYPQLFEDTTRVSVNYTSQNFGYNINGGNELPALRPQTGLSAKDGEALQSLCNLAWRYNRFTGTHWDVCHYAREYTHYSCLRGGLPRALGIIEHRKQIIVGIRPPSAHERAAALRNLSEWLDGKVSEQEKRELLQLPDNVAV